MNKYLKLSVTLLEDLHSGTGTGGGVIDAIQARDRDGRPVIRSSHIKGVLRDAAMELVKFGHAEENDVIALFGEEFEGGKRNQNGALVLQSLYCKGAEDSFLIWFSAARKKYSRVARNETLHNVEFIKSGIIFEGNILLRDERLEKLLRDCIKHTDCLGGSRNRGAGKIHTKWIETASPANDRILSEPQEPRPTLRLILRNLDPLCLPVTGFPGNIIPSECYIRGQALLGALASWAIKHDSMADADKAWLPNCSGEAVCIGNAYPLPEPWLDGKPIRSCANWDVMPLPLHIRTPKPVKTGNPAWPWWMSGAGDATLLGDKGELDDFDPDQKEPTEKPKRPGNHEFLFRPNSIYPWQRYSPVMGVQLRNRVPEDRRKKEDAKLFSMGEIAENTPFMADIRFSDIAQANEFIKIFGSILNGKEWLTVGRGGRPVVVQNCKWLPVRSKEDSDCSSINCFTLTLQSDLIARSTTMYEHLSKNSGQKVVERIPNLGFCETLDPSLLCELAGIDHLSPEPVFDTRCDTVDIRGYNAVSKLPRTPAIAIRRGSAIRISGINADKLYKVLKLKESKYLGERGKEGFGRFRLDFSPLQCNGSLFPGDGDTTILNQKEVLLARAGELADSMVEKGPSKSQWQWLRKQANAAKDKESIDKIFNTIGEHAESLGGNAWKEHTKKIKEQAALYWHESDMPLDDVKFFLDVLVRQVIVKKEKKEKRR